MRRDSGDGAVRVQAGLFGVTGGSFWNRSDRRDQQTALILTLPNANVRGFVQNQICLSFQTISIYW